MKIKDHRSVNTIYFHTLKPGEIFCYKDSPEIIYMKLSNFSEPNCKATAIDIECGELDRCDVNTEVIPLSAEVIIKYDGE